VSLANDASRKEERFRIRGSLLQRNPTDYRSELQDLDLETLIETRRQYLVERLGDSTNTAEKGWHGPEQRENTGIAQTEGASQGSPEQQRDWQSAARELTEARERIWRAREAFDDRCRELQQRHGEVLLRNQRTLRHLDVATLRADAPLRAALPSYIRS
jgi:hypothetical protein